MSHATIRRLTPVLLAAAVAVPLAACGSSSSSKPGYCQDKADLQNSIKGLTKLDITGNGLSALQTQLKQIETDARTLVASAKSDFPSQTSALSTSVDQLKADISTASSSPSPSSILAVGTAATSVVNAVKAFDTATKDTC